MLNSLLAISFGASAGAILRWQLGSLLNQVWSVMPLGTLLANLIGGLLIGLAVPWFAVNSDLSAHWRLMLVTGFLGSLTTFSTFSAEVIAMLAEQRYQHAAMTAGLHLTGSLLMTSLGFWLIRAVVTK